jgi:hypothetical protein
MSKQRLSEGQVSMKFLLNEMDYYVPTEDEITDDEMYFDDENEFKPSEDALDYAEPLDNFTNEPALDDDYVGDYDTDYSDELDYSEDFTYDAPIDVEDDLEQEEMNSFLGDDNEDEFFDDFQENKKSRRK